MGTRGRTLSPFSATKRVAMAELEIEDVAQNVNFPAEEEKVLAYWDEIDAFKTSLKCAPLSSAGLG